MGRVDAINRGMTELSPLQSVEIPSLQGKVGDEEWRVRVDLAEAQAMLAADPAIVNGVFAADIRHWVPRFHSPAPLVEGAR